MPQVVDLTSAASKDRLSRTFNAAPSSHSGNFNHIIKVIVGPTKQEFSVHKSLVIQKSSYFAQVLASNRWKESQTGIFTLQDDHASIFGSFVNWLYCGKIEYQKTPDAEIFLTECHFFGERRGTPAFCNAVLDCLHKTWSEGRLPTKDAIVLAFTESLEESALRRLVVDKCVWHGAASALQQEHALHASIPSDFTLAVCKALLVRIKKGGKIVSVRDCSVRGIGRHICGNTGCGVQFPQNGVKNLDFNGTLPPRCTSAGIWHKCRHCHFIWDSYDLTQVTEKLANPVTAPYMHGFCNTYHKHEGGKCVSC